MPSRLQSDWEQMGIIGLLEEALIWFFLLPIRKGFVDLTTDTFVSTRTTRHPSI